MDVPVFHRPLGLLLLFLACLLAVPGQALAQTGNADSSARVESPILYPQTGEGSDEALARQQKKYTALGSVLLSLGVGAAVATPFAANAPDDNVAVGAIAGALLGVSAVVLATTGTVLLVRRRKIKQQRENRSLSLQLGPGHLGLRGDF